MEQDNMTSPIDRTTQMSNRIISTAESITQKAPIFDPSVRDSLIHIINELDPFSLVKLARTCRPMYDLCFHTKGIEVRFSNDPDDSSSRLFRIFGEEDPSKPEGIRFELTVYNIGGWRPRGLVLSEVQNAVRMPIHFAIDTLHLERWEPTTRHLEALLKFLRRFRRLDLNGIWMGSRIYDWNLIANLVQEFRVKRIRMYERHDVIPPIPEEQLLFFVTNLIEFDYPGYISDDVILATTAKKAFFDRSRISVRTFKLLLEKFVNGEITRWRVACQRLQMGDDDASDPFVSACSEVMKVVDVENVNSIDKEPSVLYRNHTSPKRLYLLKPDGSNGILTVDSGFVNFY